MIERWPPVLFAARTVQMQKGSKRLTAFWSLIITADEDDSQILVMGLLAENVASAKKEILEKL